MAPIAPRSDGATQVGPGILTVAELVSRASAASAPPAQPTTTPVSVASLLRREGLAPPEPPAGGRVPAQRTADRIPVGGDVAASGRPRRRMRKGVLAAGAVLASGAVFGAAVLSTMQSAPQAADTAGLPGRPLPDPLAPGTPAALLGPTAHADALDGGRAAPASWMDAAFPAGLPAAPAAGTTATRTAPRARTATRTPQAGPATRGTGAASTLPSGSGGGAAASGGSVAGTVGSAATSAGGTVGSVGSGTPVGGVTGVVGGAASAVGGALTGSSGQQPSGQGGSADGAAQRGSGGGLGTVTKTVGGLLPPGP